LSTGSLRNQFSRSAEGIGAILFHDFLCQIQFPMGRIHQQRLHGDRLRRQLGADVSPVVW
jgi:hypothetical protein